MTGSDPPGTDQPWEAFGERGPGEADAGDVASPLEAPVGRIADPTADWAVPADGDRQPVCDPAQTRPTNPAGLDLRVATSLAEVERLAGELDEAAARGDVVAVDVETGRHADADPEAALDPQVPGGWIAGLSLATTVARAVYVPVGHDTGSLPAEEVYARLAGPLQRAPLVAHSVPMERRWLAHVGIEANLVGDTRQLMVRVAPHQTARLKEVTRRVFGHRQAEIGSLFADGGEVRFNTLDPHQPATVDYAGEDACWTLALSHRYPDLTSGADVAYQRLIADDDAIGRLEHAGVRASWQVAVVADGIARGQPDAVIAARVDEAIRTDHAHQQHTERDRIRHPDPHHRQRLQAFFDALTACPYTGATPRQASYLIRLLRGCPDPTQARRLAREVRDAAHNGEGRTAASNAIDELKPTDPDAPPPPTDTTE